MSGRKSPQKRPVWRRISGSTLKGASALSGRQGRVCPYLCSAAGPEWIVYAKVPTRRSTLSITAVSQSRTICGEMRIEVRTLVATLIVILLATSSAFSRKASQHHSKRPVPNHHSTTKTDQGGVARDPADVELDRKIGSICRGC